MARRQFLLLAGLAASFLLLLAVCLRATGSWQVAFLMGAVGAAEQTVGPGFFDKMTDALLPAAADAGAAQGAAGDLAAPSSSLPAQGPSSVVPCGSEGCGDVGALPPEGSGGEGDETAAGDAASEEENAKLELIKMKDRSRGDSRMYGGGGEPAPRRSERPSETSLEASFEGMIHKLKGRASAQSGAGAGAGGAVSLGGGSSGRSGEGGGGGGADSPILTRNGKIDPRYDSPTLRALQKVNANSAHSYSMTSDPGLEDGSKDHAGKSFDGNKNTFTDIPISVKKGAMGQKQIIIAPEEP
ncbi:MAG: hypothetical protein HY928_14900 [Elusimicrobia bacterium]|nr:hypothetical protein [Elusimicrobiota bacterium]